MTDEQFHDLLTQLVTLLQRELTDYEKNMARVTADARWGIDRPGNNRLKIR